MEEEYHIKDIKKFAKKILYLSCKYMEMDLVEAKQYIKLSNVVQIIKQKAKDRLVINEKITDEIVEEIQAWLLGVQLAKMCAEDTLNCYWSDKDGCMVFSVNEKGEDNGKKRNEDKEA